jgi:hypothetical protein
MTERNWEHLIQAYRASGQNQIDFSRAQGISVHTFRERLSQSNRKQAMEGKSVRFALLGAEESEPNRLILELKNGRKLVIEGKLASVDYLQQVIKSFDGC